MKKEYIAPAVEIHDVVLENMIALSMIGGGDASQEGEVLGTGDNDWDIWTE